jgi:hypothetical protein
MAKQLHAQIDIHASRERVWEVLTDFAAYPDGTVHRKLTARPVRRAADQPHSPWAAAP